jgi:DNA invertase Pin-like site-specific DNA recombinase
MRAFIYTRPLPGLTADEQFTELERYYRKHLQPGGYARGEALKDQAPSGSQDLSNRDQGSRLSTHVHQGDVVLAIRAAAVARNTRELVFRLRLWESFGVRSIFVQDQFDSDAEMELEDVLKLFAEFERIRSLERGQAAAAAKRRNGRLLSRHAGLGFRLVGPSRGRRKVPDLAERRVIARIVALRDAGTTLETIYRTLRDEGVRTRRGELWGIDKIRAAIEAARKDGRLCQTG